MCDTREQRHGALTSTIMRKSIRTIFEDDIWLIFFHILLRVCVAGDKSFRTLWLGRGSGPESSEGEGVSSDLKSLKPYLQGIQTIKSHSYTSFLSTLHFTTVI